MFGLGVRLLEDYLVELAVFELYFSVLIVEEGLYVPRFVAVIEVTVLYAEVAEDLFLTRPHSHFSIAKNGIVRIIRHSSVINLAIIFPLH